MNNEIALKEEAEENEKEGRREEEEEREEGGGGVEDEEGSFCSSRGDNVCVHALKTWDVPAEAMRK